MLRFRNCLASWYFLWQFFNYFPFCLAKQSMWRSDFLNFSKAADDSTSSLFSLRWKDDVCLSTTFILRALLFSTVSADKKSRLNWATVTFKNRETILSKIGFKMSHNLEVTKISLLKISFRFYYPMVLTENWSNRSDKSFSVASYHFVEYFLRNCMSHFFVLSVFHMLDTFYNLFPVQWKHWTNCLWCYINFLINFFFLFHLNFPHLLYFLLYQNMCCTSSLEFPLSSLKH